MILTLDLHHAIVVPAPLNPYPALPDAFEPVAILFERWLHHPVCVAMPRFIVVGDNGRLNPRPIPDKEPNASGKKKRPLSRGVALSHLRM